MAKKTEKQNIAALADELEEAQRIDARIKSPGGSIATAIDRRATMPTLYSDPKRMDALIDELKQTLDGYVQAAGNRGWSRGKEKLGEFLERSERWERTERQKIAIEKLSDKAAAQRLEVTYRELQKETDILKADIDIFKLNAKAAGFSDKETLQQLVRAAQDEAGPVAGFKARMQRMAEAAVRRERCQSEIDAFREEYPDDTDYQWITVSVKPCPDCQARAGSVMSYSAWMTIGTPGSGQTVCGRYCLCRLMPMKVAEEMFPTVKQFTWDKDTTVLTPAGVARKLSASQE